MIIYRFIKYLFMTRRYAKILKQVDKIENIWSNLGKMLNTTFKTDWIGRKYAVINPSLSNDEYDSNSQIFEYGPDGLSDLPGVENWLMKRLLIAQQFIQTKNLFDILTYKIEKIDDYNNYLIVFQVFPLDDTIRYTKYFLLLLLTIVLGVTALLIFI